MQAGDGVDIGVHDPCAPFALDNREILDILAAQEPRVVVVAGVVEDDGLEVVVVATYGSGGDPHHDGVVIGVPEDGENCRAPLF